MKILLFLFALTVSACANGAKDCPECPKCPDIVPTPPGYVCGPRDAYAFAPVKGDEIKIHSNWRVRVAADIDSETRADTFKADDLCIIVPGTVLKVIRSDKSFVMPLVLPPPGAVTTHGDRACPSEYVMIPVRQWSLMADEAKAADDEAASNAAKANRLKHARDLIETIPAD